MQDPCIFKSKTLLRGQVRTWHPNYEQQIIDQNAQQQGPGSTPAFGPGQAGPPLWDSVSPMTHPIGSHCPCYQMAALNQLGATAPSLV